MREVKDVEQVLSWAYAVQKVDAACSAAMPIGPAPCVSQMRAVGETGVLGVRVDRSPFVVPTVPVDAEIIHQAVMALPEDAQGLVIENALTGGRPEWLPDQRAFPVKNRNDEPVIVYHDPDKRMRPSHCPVMWLPDRAHIDYTRRVYSLWHMALGALAISLGDALEQFVVTGPVAPEHPWSKKAG